MTPKKLVELAEEEAAYNPAAAAALRSYAYLMKRLEALLSMNGCDCECDHHPEEHDDECMRCLACLVELSLSGKGLEKTDG